MEVPAVGDRRTLLGIQLQAEAIAAKISTTNLVINHVIGLSVVGNDGQRIK